jgi:hypothetical protein
MSLIPGFQKKISDEFSIHIANSEREIDEIVNLNVNVHGEDLEKPMKELYSEHPFREKILWIYIKDISSKRIVSTGVLLPEWCNIQGLKIPICEMGFVATIEEYRSRGLFKEINKIYEEAMKEHGYLLSAIRGIPYYYRRYNYEFSIDFDIPFLISSKKVPESENSNIKIYKVEKENIGDLERLYKVWASDYSVTLDFSTDAFSNKFVSDFSTEFNYQSYIIEENGFIEGFFSIGQYFGEKNVINFVSKLTRKHMISVLNFLKERKKQNLEEDSQDYELMVLTPRNSDFAQFIKSIGGKIDFEWKWQVLIPNLEEFLKIIKPLLEKRIKDSMYKNLTKDVYISNYREKIILKFVEGKIEEVKYEKGYPEPGKFDMRVPDALINKILMGDTSIEEMHKIIQDALYKPESLPLINVLFPTEDSYLLSYY